MTELTGQTFNRWTVIGSARFINRKSFSLCRCECGVERDVRHDQLTRGISKSCGCWKSEVSRRQIIEISTTHGQSSKTRTYSIWKDMRKRCLNHASKNYKNYGGRGISVCQRWSSFENFFEDMGHAPEAMTLDRINNDGNYEPSNCRWATKKTQMNNMRSNVKLLHNGAWLTIKQLSEAVDVSYHKLYQRLFRLGWPLNKAITK